MYVPDKNYFIKNIWDVRAYTIDSFFIYIKMNHSLYYIANMVYVKPFDCSQLAIGRIYSIFCMFVVVAVCELTASSQCHHIKITSIHRKKSNNFEKKTTNTSAFFLIHTGLPAPSFILLCVIVVLYVVACSFRAYPLHVSGLFSSQLNPCFFCHQFFFLSSLWFSLAPPYSMLWSARMRAYVPLV